MKVAFSCTAYIISRTMQLTLRFVNTVAVLIIILLEPKDREVKGRHAKRMRGLIEAAGMHCSSVEY